MVVWMLGSVTFAIAAVLVMWPALRPSDSPVAPSRAVSKRRTREVSA